MTNLSLINNNDQTMSSVEIAELTGKEHKNVLADPAKLRTVLLGYTEKVLTDGCSSTILQHKML